MQVELPVASIKCPVCGKSRRLRVITDSDEFGVLYPQFPQICDQCLEISRWNRNSKEPLSERNLLRLKRVTEILGAAFIHHAGNEYRFAPRQVVARNRLTLDQVVELVRLEKQLPFYQTMQSACGNYEEGFGATAWFKLMVMIGAFPDGTKPRTIGTQTVASDGHVCHSLAEREIDEALLELGIRHTREPRYQDSLFRADWEIIDAVGTTFVEYWGLQGHAEYDAKIELKRSIALRSGITLVELSPDDLEDIYTVVRERILPCLINPPD